MTPASAHPLRRATARAAALLSGLLWAVTAGAADPGTSELLRDEVRRFVRERAPRAARGVEVPPLADFELPGVEARDVEIRLYASPRETFTGSVPITAVLLAGGEELKRGVVTARVRSRVPAVVTARALRRGASIRASDLRVEEFDLAELPRGALRDPSAAVGQTAARSLPAGTLLRAQEVETRPVVSRGQLVELRYRQGALRIQGRGQAREDGQPGDLIRVRRLSSRRELSGRVDAEGVVHVEF